MLIIRIVGELKKRENKLNEFKEALKFTETAFPAFLTASLFENNEGNDFI